MSRQLLYLDNLVYIANHLKYNNKKRWSSVGLLDAKCPKCNNKAQVSDDMTTIQCKNCGYSDNYENYMEIMKSKAENMADNYQFRGNVWS